MLNMVVTTSMDRDASLDSILVYIQIQIKVEEGEFSLCPLCLTKTNLSDVDDITGRKRPVSVQMLQFA